MPGEIGIQLTGGEENPHPEICRGCPGWCCYRFFICREVDKKGKVVWGDDDDDDHRFAKNNFIHKYSRPASDGRRRQFAFTCKQYNVKEGRCGCYEDRPPLCRRFLCGAAADGRLPGPKDFPYQRRAMARERKK